MAKNKYKISYNNYFGLSPKRCRNFFLIQAGEALCAKDTVIQEHEQTYFEITYVCDGKGVCYVDSTPVSIEKNDCFFSFPGEKHAITSDEYDPLRFVFLAFYAKEKSQGNTLIKHIIKNCQSLDKRKHMIKSLLPLCKDLLQELRNEDVYSNRILSFLLEQILIECCRHITKKDAPPQYEQTDKTILAHDIITYIDENIYTIKTLNELENVFFYNVNYLSKCFHAQTGISIHKYFISKKMESALQLLQKGNNVTEVSELLGYSSIHAFSRAYKTYFHQSPSANRKKDENG